MAAVSALSSSVMRESSFSCTEAAENQKKQKHIQNLFNEAIESYNNEEYGKTTILLEDILKLEPNSDNAKKLLSLCQTRLELQRIEDEFIKPYYRNYSIESWIVTYGKDIYHKNLNPKVIFHLNKNGTYYVNENAPIWIKELFD